MLVWKAYVNESGCDLIDIVLIQLTVHSKFGNNQHSETAIVENVHGLLDAGPSCLSEAQFGKIFATWRSPKTSFHSMPDFAVVAPSGIEGCQ